MLGDEYGSVLSFLYAELRSAIVYVFENKTPSSYKKGLYVFFCVII